MTSNHPQRRRRSGPRVLQRAAPAVGAQRRALTDDGAEGTSATDAPALYFQHVHAQQPPRLRRTTIEDQIFLLVADSIHVHPQQPVNASLFAVAGCRTLIPDTFPHRNFRLLYSSHSGVTCHPYSRCEAARFSAGGPWRPTLATEASKPLRTGRPAVGSIDG
jgi:hypothetical protein